MKKLAIPFVLAFLFFSCGTQSSKQKSEESQAVVLTVDELLASADQLVNQEVVVKGTVSHVCRNGGERCFLMGSSDDLTIRVEAGAPIGAFKQEQMGNEIQITGILKEVPIDESYLAEQEAALEQGTEADPHHALSNHGSGKVDTTLTAEEHGEVKKQQLEEMKAQVKASEKGYVPVYFIEGISQQEVVTEVR